MGWIIFHKPKDVSPSDYFRNVFSSEPNHELIDIAIVKRTQCYMAVRLRDTGEVIALVYMLTYGRGWNNFGYKSMSEFCGPAISECPKRILKLLSPLNDENDPNGWAREWRKRCEENAQRGTKGLKVNEGEIIKVEKELEFSNGGKYQYFRKQSRRNRWTALVDIEGRFVDSVTVKFIAGKHKFEKIEKLS